MQPAVYVDDGIKPVYRVTTRLGRQVESTLCHPFLTVGGWKPLAELQVGEAVAVPRERYVEHCLLFERGRMVDEYLSVPTYYGELSTADELSLSANPTLAARLTRRGRAQ